MQFCSEWQLRSKWRGECKTQKGMGSDSSRLADRPRKWRPADAQAAGQQQSFRRCSAPTSTPHSAAQRKEWLQQATNDSRRRSRGQSVRLNRPSGRSERRRHKAAVQSQCSTHSKDKNDSQLSCRRSGRNFARHDINRSSERKIEKKRAKKETNASQVFTMFGSSCKAEHS